ncbi:MAG: hypothetical protein HZB39_14355 [Planctomycetes bacterium]|nr:hypothetical protein [Planctomycetota bacterium]
MIALLAALALMVAPQEPGPLARAEAAYLAGDHAAASTDFATALDEPGAPRHRIEFALGNCAWRLGHPAEAAWRYRRALREAPRDPATWNNLRFVERRLALDGDADAGLVAALEALVEVLTPRELFLLGIALEIVGLAGALMLRRRPLTRAACIVALGLGIACGVMALRDEAVEGVVLGSDVALRADPHADLPIRVRLRAGEPVRVLEGSDRWLHVATGRGRGWVERVGVGLVGDQ